MRHIADLSVDELQQLQNNGHIGIETKNIAELKEFFENVDAILKEKEAAIIDRLPINKTYALLTTKHSAVFKVIGVIDIPDTKYISHLLRVEMVDLNDDNGKYKGVKYFKDFEFGYNEQLNKIILANVETGEIWDVNEIPEDVFNNLYNS